MATTVEDLMKRAMELSAEERAQLADELVESLDTKTLSELDKRWLAVAKRRRDEVRNGYGQTVPGPQALQQVRDTIRK